MKAALHTAVSSLQQFLTESTAKGATSADTVRQQATAAAFPYPELAAQVFTFLQKKRVAFHEGFKLEDISEAFMALLMDADAVNALGAGKVQNPWIAVRQAIRHTGQNFGASLIDVYNTVRQTGLGYTPTILDLAGQLAAVWAKLSAGGLLSGAELEELALAEGLDPWKAALLAAWFARRKKGLGAPTDRDLEEMLFDRELRSELAQQADGPWDVYGAQAEALRCLRQFGESLESLDEEMSRLGG